MLHLFGAESVKQAAAAAAAAASHKINLKLMACSKVSEATGERCPSKLGVMKMTVSQCRWNKLLVKILEKYPSRCSFILKLHVTSLKNELLLFQYFEHNCRITLLYKSSQWLPRNSSISCLVTKSIKKHTTISLFFMDTVGVYCVLSEIITFVTCCRKKDHPALRFQPRLDVFNLV